MIKSSGESHFFGTFTLKGFIWGLSRGITLPGDEKVRDRDNKGKEGWKIRENLTLAVKGDSNLMFRAPKYWFKGLSLSLGKITVLC